MKAIVIDQFGGADEIQEKDVPKPHPEAGEVLIKGIYSSINPVD